MSERKDIRRWNALSVNAEETLWECQKLMADFQNASFLCTDAGMDMVVLITEARNLLRQTREIFAKEETHAKTEIEGEEK